MFGGYGAKSKMARGVKSRITNDSEVMGRGRVGFHLLDNRVDVRNNAGREG